MAARNEAVPFCNMPVALLMSPLRPFFQQAERLRLQGVSSVSLESPASPSLLCLCLRVHLLPPLGYRSHRSISTNQAQRKQHQSFSHFSYCSTCYCGNCSLATQCYLPQFISCVFPQVPLLTLVLVCLDCGCHYCQPLLSSLDPHANILARSSDIDILSRHIHTQKIHPLGSRRDAQGFNDEVM